jgi:hypothetical protein
MRLTTTKTTKIITRLEQLRRLVPELTAGERMLLRKMLDLIDDFHARGQSAPNHDRD